MSSDPQLPTSAAMDASGASRAGGPADLAVSVRDVCKEFLIGRHVRETLRESIANRLRDPLGRRRRETFQALRDVSFDVRKGEVVGLIGRNGAGKSTLLKILSRITPPTSGSVDIWGRVGSLLEVGTGFHPELTGRENIFLNGSILGMTRREIEGRFDEIVDFSGVEKFLDTPVKRYSSGMFVRLAFSVAAHLEPEVLIVDEVLAVGDAEFQSRCLGKMQDVAGHGRTVIFVSHNLGTIQQLCTRGVLMVEGRVVNDGPVDAVVSDYLSRLVQQSPSAGDAEIRRAGDGSVRLTAVRLLNDRGEESNLLMAGGDMAVDLDYRNIGGRRRVQLRFNIYNDRGAVVTSAHTELTNVDLGRLAPGGTLRCRIPRLPLTLGRYRIAISVVADDHEADVLPGAATFDVISSVFYESGRAQTSTRASFLLEHEWTHEPAGPFSPLPGKDPAASRPAATASALASDR